jgi:hypothetical protein
MAGAIIGALLAIPISQMVRWHSKILTNLFIYIAAGLNLVLLFEVFTIAWFIYGFSVGLFSVLPQKCIDEFSRIVIKLLPVLNFRCVSGFF